MKNSGTFFPPQASITDFAVHLIAPEGMRVVNSVTELPLFSKQINP